MLENVEILERRRNANARRAAARSESASPRDRFLILLAIALFSIPLLPSFAFGVQFQVHLAAIVMLLLLSRQLRDRIPRSTRPWIWRETDCGIAAIGIAALLSLLATDSLCSAVSASFPIVTLVAAYGVFRKTVRSARAVELLTLGLLGSGAILAAFGCVGAVRFEFALAAGEALPADRSAWLSTPFYPHSYAVAQLLAPCVPLALAQLFGSSSTRFRVVAAIALPIIVSYLLLVLSRAIWIATALGCALVLIASWHSLLRGSLRRWLVVALVSGAAVVLLGTEAESLLTRVRERLVSLLDPTALSFNFSRLQVWGDSLRLATDAMPLGIGIGRFAAAFAEYDTGRRFIPHAHQQFLHWLAEIGPLGCLGLMLALVSTLRSYARRVRATVHDASTLPATRGLFAALVTFVCICATETPLLYAPAATMLGFLAGASHHFGKRDPRRIVLAQGIGPARFDLVLRATITCAAVWFCLNATAGVLGMRAQTAAARESHARAIRLASLATRLQPHLDWIHWISAQSQRAIGDLVGAEQSLVRYSELAPRVPAALMQRAEIQFAHKQHASALEHLFMARRRAAPENLVEVDYQIGNCLTYLGRDEEARSLYLNLIQRGAHVRYPDLLRRTAECLKRLQRDPVLEKSLRAELARTRAREP